MDPLLLQLVDILITPPGNLIYHLGLAVSVVAALQAVFIDPRLAHGAYFQRTAWGLGFLLLAQMLVFLTSGLAWQGLIDPLFLPPFDRLIICLSLVCIVWLWAFPHHRPGADAITLLFSLGVLIFSMVTLAQWLGQTQSMPFNQTWFDFAWELFSMSIVLLGSGALLLYRPERWGFGFIMLGLIFVGLATQYLLPLTTENYWGIVRLSMLAAYPLLLTLPARLISATTPNLVQNLQPDTIQEQLTKENEQAKPSRNYQIELPVQSVSAENPARAKADLNAVLDTVTNRTMPLLQEKEITMFVDLPAEIPILDIDETVLEQILTELICSAATTSQKGEAIGVLAQIHQPPGESEAMLVQISYSDGVDKLGDSVHENDHTGDKQSGESRIDLSQINNLVKTQGGRAWVDRRDDLTTTVNLLLPR